MKLLFGLLALGVLVLALSVTPQIQDRIELNNRITHDRAMLQLERQRYEYERARAWDTMTMPANVVLQYAAFAGLIVAGGILLHFFQDSRRRRDRDHQLVNVQGYPIARRSLELGDDWTLDLIRRALELDKQARLAEASRPNVPLHLTYSPKFAAGSSAEALPPAAVLATVPTFAELLGRNRVGKGNPLILGFDQGNGQELTGTWLDLYSTAIAGLPGTGKTTTQRFLACQVALQGGRFVVIDPHAGAADDSLAATLAPLSSTFVCDPASGDKQILEAVRYVADVGARRIAGKDRDTTPLILWADELTALLGRSAIGEELAELLERVAQEYRKRHVFVCGSGQIWTAARTTSELRDSFASAIVHRMKRGQARMLLPTEEAAGVERLETGRAVLWRTSGATTTIAIPNTTASDVTSVAGLLTSDAASMPSLGKWPGSGAVVGAEVATSGLSDALNLKAARVRQMLREKRSQNEIIAAVWNASGGRAYNQAAEEYREILSSLV